MSWMEDLERDFVYKCGQGHESVYQMKSSTDEAVIRADTNCLVCGGLAEYTRFKPLPMKLMGKVSYEQNGRKAYRITDGKGNVTHISKTKYDYLESFGKVQTDEKGNRGLATIKPAYTDAYAEHLKNVGQEHLLETTVIKNKVREQANGAVTPANVVVGEE